METIELSTDEIRLIIKSLKNTQDWLLNQKGTLSGALIGHSKIDKFYNEMQLLIDKLSNLDE